MGMAAGGHTTNTPTDMPNKKEKPEGLRKLLEDCIADMYYAEKRLVTATKKLAKAAVNEELQQAMLDHHEETKQHVERLEEVFALLDKPAKGKKCDAIDGIVEEADDIVEEFKDDIALDAAIVAAAQKAEHYEIASYGSMVAFAEQLGLKKVGQLLNSTLEEEKGTDAKLSALAEEVLNAAAEA